MRELRLGRDAKAPTVIAHYPKIGFDRHAKKDGPPQPLTAMYN